MNNPPLLFGPYGSSALAFIDRFTAYGANSLWFHGFDPAAFEGCQRHGIAPCVEFKTFRTDFDARPELIPTGVDGRPVRYGELVQGVCLSQSDFLAETEANLLEGLRAYQPAGVWLDYLTYTGWFETPDPDLQDSCFCPACVIDFCESTNIDASTPEQILQTHSEPWRRHKCERIAGFANHYAELIRQHLPGCTVGAYMCPWLPGEFDGALTRIFAQDYGLLANAIDVFTPLIYVKKSGRRPDWGRAFLESADTFIPTRRKVQLILDALDFPDSLLAAAEADRASWGIQLYGGASVFGDPSQAALFARCVEQIRQRLANGSDNFAPSD